ncbi:MAG: flagellar type III secretion system protein FliR [Deltaproteobacteria bacterium]|nr:flagellar type III secretion system protein FliR [Deltaproteobacteria bacterium]
MITIAQIEMFVLVFIRIAAIVFMAPVFSSQNIPPRIKAGLSAVIALLLFQWVKVVRPTLPMNLCDLAVALIGEVALGAALGYMFSLIFAAVMLAGQVAGFQMGFGIVNIVDPMSSNQMSVIGLFKNIMALLLFLSINAHHWILWALAESFNKIPLMGFTMSGNHVEYLVQLTGQMFVMAVKIAAPIMAVSLFASVAMGLIARSVPQINVFIVGFPLKIAAGLFALGISLPFILSYLKDVFERRGTEVLHLFSLV